MHSVRMSVEQRRQSPGCSQPNQARSFVTAQHAMMLEHSFEYVLLALDTAGLAVTDNLRTMSVACVLEKPF